MVREWRHLKLLKRKLDKSPWDFKDTPPGELPVPAGSLAVKCPACPWPGINLDEGWETDEQDPYVCFAVCKVLLKRAYVTLKMEIYAIYCY